MRYRTLATSVSAVLMIAAGTQYLPPATTVRADTQVLPNTGLGDPATLQLLYDKWRTGAAGARVMTVPLIVFGGLGAENVTASGQLKIDTADGKATAAVFGLPPGDWELWAIDNQSGRGATTLPDAGDRTMSLGRFEANREGGLALEANLPPGFQLDRAAVTRAGRNPADGFVLMGSANLYERLANNLVLDGDGGKPVEDAGALARLVARGRTLFHNETFQGNGRRCGTCHQEKNNFTIDPAFIAPLDPGDPLFVHERTLALNTNFENSQMIRRLGLITANPDGLDDLPNKYVLRAVPPIQALGTQIAAPEPVFAADFTNLDPATALPERLGWGNDNLPLREFAIGAIIQHGTKTLARKNGTDYRLPSDEELDAIAAYMLSIGRGEDFDLTKLKLVPAQARRGQELYTDTGNIAEPNHKNCNACHFNAGGTGAFAFNPGAPGFLPKLDAVPLRANVTTGTNVNGLPLAIQLRLPRDGGFGAMKLPFGSFGNFAQIPDVPPFPVEEFNSMSVVESADTAPYFHNHTVATLEEAVAFYGTKQYQDQLSIGDPVAGPIPIKISDSPRDPEVLAISTFLRILNTLENIRSAISAAERARRAGSLADAADLAGLAREEVIDALEVTNAGSLANHDFAILVPRTRLTGARVALEAAREATTQQALEAALQNALAGLRGAREVLVDVNTLPASFRN